MTLEDCARYISTDTLDRTVYDLDSLARSSGGCGESVSISQGGSEEGFSEGSQLPRRASGLKDCDGGSGETDGWCGSDGFGDKCGVLEGCDGGEFGGETEELGGGSGGVEGCSGGSGERGDLEGCGGEGGELEECDVGSGEFMGGSGWIEECGDGCGGDHLWFESRFECGNLRKAVQVQLLVFWLMLHTVQLTCFRFVRVNMI